MLEVAIGEHVAAEMRRSIGLEPDEIIGALAFATRLLGPGSVVRARPGELAGYSALTADYTILVRPDLPIGDLEFAVYYGCAGAWFASHGDNWPSLEVERAHCSAVAASLLAPEAVFRVAVEELGPTALEALAVAFRASQTAMALRIGETRGVSVRVVSRPLAKTWSRGPSIDWAANSYRCVHLTDAPDTEARLVV